MDLRLYLGLFRRHWIAILLLTALGAGVGAGLAWAKPATYTAKQSMYVTAQTSPTDFAQGYQGSLLAQQWAKSYSTLATDDQVLRQVISTVHLPYSVEKLRGEVTATKPTDTVVITITVRDTSPQRAIAIANGYGPVFSDFVANLTTTQPSGVIGSPSPGIAVSSLESAALVPQKVASQRVLDTALGGIVGLVLGVGFAVVREVTDTRIRNASDAARAGGSTVLGVLPGGRTSNGLAAPQLANGQRRSATVEAYRRLAVNLELAASGLPPAVAVVAPTAPDGTFSTAADLAITFAEAGHRVVLVDADLGRANPSGQLGLPPELGLADLLAGRIPLERALKDWRTGLPLHVITSGITAPAQATAVNERALARLRTDLADRADLVVIAAPPVLLKTDSVLIARNAGHALVLARTMTTRSGELADAVAYLGSAGVDVLGIVLRAGQTGRRRHRKTPVTPEQAQVGDITRAFHPDSPSGGADGTPVPTRRGAP